MNLALDYDDTYTRDPEFWNLMIDLAQHRGHKVYCITARSERHSEEVLTDLARRPGRDSILFTGGRAKKSFAYSRGISIDVWIDDSPFFVENGIKIDDGVSRLWD